MSSEQPEEAVPARVSFFAALGVPLSWVLAAINVTRGPDTPQQRVWTRALVALALFDVLVLVSAVTLSQNAKELGSTLKPPPVQSVIGVSVEPDPIDEGLKVAHIPVGSPAEAANIVVGDVVDTCDGVEVRSGDELRACVGKHLPGEQVSLRVLRGELIREEVKVLTRAPSELSSPLSPLRPLAGSCRPSLKRPPRGPFFAWLLFVALGAFVAVRRGGFATLVLAVGIAVIAVGGTFATAGLCALGVPESVRAMVELPLSPLSLLLLAAVVNRLLLRGESPGLASGAPNWWVTAGLAGWTHVLMMVRLAVVIGAFVLTFKVGPVASTPVEELLAETARSPLSAALFLLTAAILAPLAEELFFRGVALTAVTRVMRPSFAIVALALVFGLLHGGYGVRTPIVISLGIILGWARHESRGLKAPIALHFAQNAVVSVIFLLR